jgi:hypothetical protein
MMPEFNIGDAVEVPSQNEDGKFPIVFEVTGIHKDPQGKLLYTGQGQPWWKEDQLDYFLNDEQRKAQRLFETVIHCLKADVSSAKSNTQIPTFKLMPDWFQTWYLDQLAEIVGWKYECRHG